MLSICVYYDLYVYFTLTTYLLIADVRSSRSGPSETRQRGSAALCVSTNVVPQIMTASIFMTSRGIRGFGVLGQGGKVLDR